ncbi:uncharacterized protein A4U43_C05F23560 [Asparagus officinalis]|uniref:Uncharacterized protein n=1 Tax=Asparagus officinalis TaxID=4686 RepID=A0A5P1EWG0_ASPOF|nr:uncharacterized protein A4U43_C05F23560 [Asparagus officinalis]
MIFKSNAKPHLQRIAIVVFKAYEASKNTFRQHVVRIQEVAYPHLQDAREFLKPYIDKAVDISKPHIANLQYVVMPYKKHVARTYRKSLRTARTYHRQMSNIVGLPIAVINRYSVGLQFVMYVLPHSGEMPKDTTLPNQFHNGFGVRRAISGI